MEGVSGEVHVLWLENDAKGEEVDDKKGRTQSRALRHP